MAVALVLFVLSPVTLLASVVRELGGRPPVTVEPLPQVPGVAYMPLRGEAA